MSMNANTTNVNDNLETECIDVVKKMFEQYPNVNMKQKIHHYIKNILPGVCENACQQQKQREERNNVLEEKSDEFIEEFIAKTRFFYYSPTDLFFTYSDEKIYEVVKEDNIQHLTRIVPPVRESVRVYPMFWLDEHGVSELETS